MQVVVMDTLRFRRRVAGRGRVGRDGRRSSSLRILSPECRHADDEVSAGRVQTTETIPLDEERRRFKSILDDLDLGTVRQSKQSNPGR